MTNNITALSLEQIIDAVKERRAALITALAEKRAEKKALSEEIADLVAAQREVESTWKKLVPKGER